MNINKELSAVLELHKVGTLSTLDAVTRIVDLHIGAAQPDVLAMTEDKLEDKGHIKGSLITG